MRVAIISKADSSGGGASRVAENLARSINLSDGHQAIHINSWRKEKFSFTKPLFEKFTNLYFKILDIEKRTGYVEYFPIEYLQLRKLLRRYKADVVHFHDISSAYSPNTLNKISNLYPVVWTFHDVSPVTGGCLYPGSCSRFLHGCGDCPLLGYWPIDTTIDKTDLLAKTKIEMLEKSRIYTIAPSIWMKELVSQRISKQPTVIFNGIDTDIYSAANKQKRKKILHDLKLDTNKVTFAITCSDFDDARKGVKDSLTILNDLYSVVGNSFQLVLLGNISQEIIDLLPDVPLHIAGYVFNEEQKSRLLSACDIFLYTSLEDNQPLSVLEALSSGCSIFGYKTGGIPELESYYDRAIKLHTKHETQEVVDDLVKVINGIEELPNTEVVSSISSNLFSQSEHTNKHLNIYFETINNYVK